MLRQVPTLYWAALVLVLLAMWAQDVRGIVVAGLLWVVGSAQLVRAERARAADRAAAARAAEHRLDPEP